MLAGFTLHSGNWPPSIGMQRLPDWHCPGKHTVVAHVPAVQALTTPASRAHEVQVMPEMPQRSFVSAPSGMHWPASGEQQPLQVTGEQKHTAPAPNVAPHVMPAPQTLPPHEQPFGEQRFAWKRLQPASAGTLVHASLLPQLPPLVSGGLHVELSPHLK